MLPLVTLVALDLGYIVGGAVLIEVIFSWPGIGLAMYDAIGQRDYPMLQGGFLILTVSVIILNVAADLLYFRLDPRISECPCRSDMVVVSRVGGRISMIVGFAATPVAMIIGGGVGILSGYFGGWVDGSLMRVTDYLLVIPDLVFMMVIADLWGASLFHVIIVIGILEWTSTARIIRAQVMSVRERAYVKRARGMGAGNFRIVWRHILPQVGPLL